VKQSKVILEILSCDAENVASVQKMLDSINGYLGEFETRTQTVTTTWIQSSAANEHGFEHRLTCIVTLNKDM
jgi:hypothetical protein